VFGFLVRIFDVVSGNARRRLNPFETTLVEAVCEAYPNELGAVIPTQLTTRYIVDRANDKLHTICFRSEEKMPLIQVKDYKNAFFSVRFRHHGQIYVGKVEIYRGKVFSIRCRENQKVFSADVIEILSVYKSRSKDRLDEEIDRAEHGRWP